MNIFLQFCIVVNIVLFNILLINAATNDKDLWKKVNSTDKKEREKCKAYQLAMWESDLNPDDTSKKEKMAKAKEEYESTVTADLTEFSEKTATEEYLKHFIEANKKELEKQQSHKKTETEEKKLQEIVKKMMGLWGKKEFCSGGSREKCLSREEEFERILKTKDNNGKYLNFWKNSTSKSKTERKNEFKKYLRQANATAKKLGKNRAQQLAEQHFKSYEDFSSQINGICKGLEPEYKKVHKYIRGELKKKFPRAFPKESRIPAHLYDYFIASQHSPFHKWKMAALQRYINLTRAVKTKEWTYKQMAKLAETYYNTMGLQNMTDEFWKYSRFDENCTNSKYYDTCDGKDIRIRACVKKDYQTLGMIHAFLGAIEHKYLYANLPTLYHHRPDMAFLGSTMYAMFLSVDNDCYMEQLGLGVKCGNSEDYMMMRLFSEMKKLNELCLLTNWKLGLFKGEFSANEMNKKWYEYRSKTQGVCSPISVNEDSVDATLFQQISNDEDLIGRWVKTVGPYQIFNSTCIGSGHTGDLYKCTHYKHDKAGEIKKRAGVLGNSVHWSEAFKAITGTRKLEIGAMLKYWQPFLKKIPKTEGNGESEDWTTKTDSKCKSA